MSVDIDRKIVAELLGYSSVEDMYDYRTTGHQDAERERYLKIFERHRLDKVLKDEEVILRTKLEGQLAWVTKNCQNAMYVPVKREDVEALIKLLQGS